MARRSSPAEPSRPPPSAHRTVVSEAMAVSSVGSSSGSSSATVSSGGARPSSPGGISSRRQLPSVAHAAVDPRPVAATPKPTLPARPKRKRAKTERRREQCRRNQARYRDKQRVEALALEDTVEELRLEVARLRVQRQSLYDCVNTRDCAVRVMLEYFRLFRYSLTVDVPSGSASSPSRRRLPPLEQQLAYVTSAFHEYVLVGNVRGREFFLEQTRRFATLYDGLAGILDEYEVLPEAESTTTINLIMHMDMTVTPMTIRYVFPHLLRIEHNDIRWKLLGSRLRCPTTGFFRIDAAGKIVATSWTMDLVAGLQPLLRLDEIAVVLQQAQIANESILLESGDDVGRGDVGVEGFEPQREPWSDHGGVGSPRNTQRDHAFARDGEHREVGVYEDTVRSDGEGGELIHDGKGDDFVMV